MTSEPGTLGPCVVTGPTDTTCDALTGGDPAAQQHLHDYWGSADRLVVLEETKPSPVGFGGGPTAIARFRPEPGSVVPQGTAEVAITIAWTTQPDDVVGGLEVQVKSAGMGQFKSLGLAQQGVPLAMATDHPDNDLPHQALSGWLVDVVVHPDPTLGFAHYYGDVSVRLEAVRGLDIPLYPGHPDRWEGRREITLLDLALDASYVGDPRSTLYACGGNASCLRPLRPDLGAIVPDGTATVDVVLTWDTPEPTALGLYAHGASDDEFVDVQPYAATPQGRTYSIPVERGMEDGPYTQQSLWEFLPYVAGPVRDGAFLGNYTVTAIARHG